MEPTDLETPTPLPRQKYDYDSSSVRKRFFREALLQITIPFLLKKLAPTCKSVSTPALPPPPPNLLQPLDCPPSTPQAPGGVGTQTLSWPDWPGHPSLCPCAHPALQELPRFQELIFEDFARFILVENTYEEVVLQTVMKDILQGTRWPCPLEGWLQCWVGLQG